MQVLHFRRTFLEKLFAIHSMVELNEPIGRGARHYADLYLLGAQPEIIQLLGTDEDRGIRQDIDALGVRHFPKYHVTPADLSFASSRAILLPGDLLASVKADYEKDCVPLFRASPPPFEDVITRLRSLPCL